MLIFIQNTPRAYAWGSRDALPNLLGTSPNGEPQAELWLGDHPSAPASVAKGSPARQTLIELIESDPERYGVNGKHLPFLLKVLAIGAPLSLQVHPNKQQAEAGFAAEEAAGVPRDAHHRNYGDPNHKPELLVALSEVSALCGFRPLDEAAAELRALAAAAPEGAGRDALRRAAEFCAVSGDGAAEQARREMLAWVLGSGSAANSAAGAAVETIGDLVQVSGGQIEGVDARRVTALEKLTSSYAGDPGVLLSLLLHLVTLQPGEAVYLGAQQLHAYLDGIGVEVMAASDNVLRAGLTEKHVDVDELMRIVDMSTLDEPRFETHLVSRGLVAYRPNVPDFCLIRARLLPSEDLEADELADDVPEGFDASDARSIHSCAAVVQVEAEQPLVLITTSGRVRVERVGGELEEVANVRRGQSLYISAGEPVELSGRGEAFIATVGKSWPRVS